MSLSICNYKNMDEKEILIDLGNNICAERNRARLSQCGLAEKIGMSEKHLGRIERGKANPKITNIIAILQVLDIPFEALYKK